MADHRETAAALTAAATFMMREPAVNSAIALDIEDRNPYHLLRDLILFPVVESDNRGA